MDRYPGLNPRAESCYPSGIKTSTAVHEIHARTRTPSRTRTTTRTACHAVGLAKAEERFVSLPFQPKRDPRDSRAVRFGGRNIPWRRSVRRLNLKTCGHWSHK